MTDLDDRSVYERLDPSGLHLRLQGLPSQCRQAWQEAKRTEVPADWRQCTEVIVAGMGGSAIAGNLVSDLAGPSSSMPIRIVRDFRIPGILTGNKPGQLIVVCSFSGETEETLAMFDHARSTGAPMAVITCGGARAQPSAEAGIPAMTVDAPGAPRSAGGYRSFLHI